MKFCRYPDGRISVWFNGALLFVESESHVNRWLKEGGFNQTWRDVNG